MLRGVFSVVLGVLLSASANAALLVSYGFDGGSLSPTYNADPSVITASSISGPFVSSNATNQYLTLSQTNSTSYVSYATFTVDGGFVESISFDGASFGPGFIKITNSSNSEIVEGNVWQQTFTNFSTNYVAPFTANNTVFTIWMKSQGGGNVQGKIDNINISGVVPEPASIAIFGLAGLGLLARRRRVASR
jgi:hypothetical protein